MPPKSYAQIRAEVTKEILSQLGIGQPVVCKSTLKEALFGRKDTKGYVDGIRSYLGEVEDKLRVGRYRPLTAKTKNDHWAFLLKHFDGNKLLSQITKEQVQQFVFGRLECRNKSSHIHKRFEELGRLFAWAVENKLCAVNPCKGVNLPVEEEEELEGLEVEDVKSAISASYKDGHQSFLALVIIAFTSLRIANVMQLTWRRLDLVNRWIKFSKEEMKRTGRGQNVKARPHTAYICNTLAKFIERVRPKNEAEWDSPVITIKANTIHHYLPEMCERKGLKPITPKQVRAYVCTYLHDEEVDPRVIDRIMSHRSSGNGNGNGNETENTISVIDRKHYHRKVSKWEAKDREALEKLPDVVPPEFWASTEPKQEIKQSA
jgi:integrase